MFSSQGENKQEKLSFKNNLRKLKILKPSHAEITRQFEYIKNEIDVYLQNLRNVGIYINGVVEKESINQLEKPLIASEYIFPKNKEFSDYEKTKRYAAILLISELQRFHKGVKFSAQNICEFYTKLEWIKQSIDELVDKENNKPGTRIRRNGGTLKLMMHKCRFNRIIKKLKELYCSLEAREMTDEEKEEKIKLKTSQIVLSLGGEEKCLDIEIKHLTPSVVFVDCKSNQGQKKWIQQKTFAPIPRQFTLNLTININSEDFNRMVCTSLDGKKEVVNLESPPIKAKL